MDKIVLNYWLKDAGIYIGDTSMEEKIVSVLNEMSEYLSITQMKKLQEVIIRNFSENEVVKTNIPNEEFLKMFLAAKRIEGVLGANNKVLSNDNSKLIVCSQNKCSQNYNRRNKRVFVGLSESQQLFKCDDR